MTKETQTMTVDLPVEMYDRLSEKAESEFGTKASVIRRALHKILEESK